MTERTEFEALMRDMGVKKESYEWGQHRVVWDAARRIVSGQEPVAQIVRWRAFTGHDCWDIKVWDKSLKHGTNLYSRPASSDAQAECARMEFMPVGGNDHMYVHGTREAIDALKKRLEHDYHAPSRIERLRKALFEARDAMRVMSDWVKKSDPAGHSWAVRMVDRANAVLNHEPEPASSDAQAACGKSSGDTTWVALTDDDRQKAFESLPDMLEGFLKKWGWLNFAKEIERRCREKNAATVPVMDLSESQIDAAIMAFGNMDADNKINRERMSAAIKAANGGTQS